jgi:hypothetical protein
MRFLEYVLIAFGAMILTVVVLETVNRQNLERFNSISEALDRR